MIRKPPIRFGVLVRSNRSRPGLFSWLITTALLFVGIYLGFFVFPLVGILAIGLGLFVFLPALIGSFAGWFLGGVRNECKQFFHHRKMVRSFQR